MNCESAVALFHQKIAKSKLFFNSLITLNAQSHGRNESCYVLLRFALTNLSYFHFVWSTAAYDVLPMAIQFLGRCVVR